MANAGGWIVAVDFGTAFSKAAAVPCAVGDAAAPRQARPLRVGSAAGANSPHLVPSALFLQDRHILFGPEAIERAQRSNVGKREALQSFKLLLGTNDLESFLPTRPSRRVDPDGAFSYHDLITLFLAYFIGLVHESFREDPSFGGAGPSIWRYTRPGWFSDRTEQDHALTVQLFTRAASVLAALPRAFWKRPLSYEDARRALSQGAPAPMVVEAGVFEATAAVAAYLPDHTGSAWSMIVIDMGAGTTDFGSYISVPGVAGPGRLQMLNHTIAIAGDDIDRSLLNVIIQKAKGFKSQRELGGLWRHLLPSIRARKEEMFATGELDIQFFGHSVSCTVAELRKSKDFRVIVDAISRNFARVVERTGKLAGKYKLPETVVITSGGGARLPFIAEMVAKAAGKRSPMRLRVAPPRPVWVETADFRNEIGPMFNQLAIAIGGAMAPREMLIGAKVEA